MEILKLKLTGESPLLMHSERGANPLDPLVRELKVLTDKKKKTDEGYAEKAFLDWSIGIYHDEKIGPYLPGLNIRASIVAGGKMNKLGANLQKGTMVLDEKVKLEYDGPRSIDGLWSDTKYRDIRSVVVNGKRVMRCRPIFHQWSVAVEIYYDTQIINVDDVILSANNAGKYIGIGDFRPGKGNGSFGRYDVEVI